MLQKHLADYEQDSLNPEKALKPFMTICPNCKGTGSVRVGYDYELCPVCGGTGNLDP
jgi:DnaJ-class molecular chaperone